MQTEGIVLEETVEGNWKLSPHRGLKFYHPIVDLLPSKFQIERLNFLINFILFMSQ